MTHQIAVQTHRREEFVDITSQIQEIIKKQGLKNGICLVYCPHTTAGITINENADPDVVSDMLAYMRKLVPERAGFAHMEGNSDAHIKSSLFGCEKMIPVVDGRLVLGTWQSVYFCEFDGARSRRCHVQLIGE